MSETWIGKRILIKLSGEALMGDKEFGLDLAVVNKTAEELADISKAGIELALVVGGGNLFRGVQTAAGSLDRVSADQMGMMSTLLNGITLRAAIESQGADVVLLSGLSVPAICDDFTQRGALSALKAGKVVIFAGGVGSPFFTTDTGAALRACEMGCDVLMKGTQVDGVYSADPNKDPNAIHLPVISFDEVIAKNLAVMDTAALTLARSSGTEIVVFNMHGAGAILKAARGEGIFSRVVAR